MIYLKLEVTILDKSNTRWNNFIKYGMLNLAEWVVIIFSVVILAFLTFLVFRYHFNAENSIPMQSNIFIHLLVVLLVVGGCRLLGHLINPYPKVCRWISIVFLSITLIYVGIISFSYVSQTLILPRSDEKACFDLALRFLNSDFGAVVPKDSYLTLWPFQTGFIFILEKIMRIFNVQEPLFFQQMNCFYLLLIITSGYCMICMFTRKIEGHLLYLFLMAGYMPLIASVSAVYGDLPGTALTMFSITCYILFYKAEQKWLKILAIIGFVSSTILACTYKGNCLIYIIAVLLITFVLQLRDFRPLFTIVVIITAIISMFSTDITQKYYEHYADNECGKGMPAVGWIAMGLQYNGEEAIPGGWNGFHSATFMENEYDYDTSKEIFKESIANSINTFLEEPEFARKFFYNKSLKQWANQTHGAWWSVNSLYDVSRDENTYWVQYILNTKYNEQLLLMDYHESIIYGILFFAVLSLLVNRIRKQQLPFYILLPIVTFIGGFLFSLIWEGQTDVVMSYPIIMLPVALSICCEFNFRLRKNTTGHHNAT